jgi:LSD1 subclass zinc finger protein
VASFKHDGCSARLLGDPRQTVWPPIFGGSLASATMTNEGPPFLVVNNCPSACLVADVCRAPTLATKGSGSSRAAICQTVR